MRLLLALLLVLLPLPALASLRVAATVPDLGAIAQEVLKDKGTVTTLSLGTQDPHFVDARPNLALDLSRADALLLVGLDLEIGWLPNLLTGARNPKIQTGGSGYIDTSTFVPVLETPTQAIDRSMGDIHPGGNPHYLYDPRQAARVATGIAEKFAALDPANAAAFRTNAADFVKRLDAARGGWESKLGALRGREIATYHRSWVYLCDWLGLKPVVEIEPKPGIPPSPAQVAKVLTTVQARGIKLILQEVYYPETTPALVASKTGAVLVRLSGGAATGETYITRMDTMVKAIASGAGL